MYNNVRTQFTLSFYFICISRVVFNTVALKDAEIHTAEMTTKLASLESLYVSKEKNITTERATELGFNEVKTSLFSFAGFSSSLSARNIP